MSFRPFILAEFIIYYYLILSGTRKNYPSVIAHTQSPVMVDQSDSKLTITCTSKIEPFSREAPNWRWIKNNTFDLRLSHNEETARTDMSEAGMYLF